MVTLLIYEFNILVSDLSFFVEVLRQMLHFDGVD
jgi:hypothetical protein